MPPEHEEQIQQNQKAQNAFIVESDITVEETALEAHLDSTLQSKSKPADHLAPQEEKQAVLQQQGVQQNAANASWFSSKPARDAAPEPQRVLKTPEAILGQLKALQHDDHVTDAYNSLKDYQDDQSAENLYQCTQALIACEAFLGLFSNDAVAAMSGHIRAVYDALQAFKEVVESRRKLGGLLKPTNQPPLSADVDLCANDAAKDIRWKDKSSELLFPEKLDLTQIRQGGVGDCFLLAGLTSLVVRSPQKIYDCMCDNGDGTVTVRFYDICKAQPYPEVFVRVKKEVPQANTRNGYKDLYAKDILWVQMIEKAYAASGLHDDVQAMNGWKVTGAKNYDSIDGGTQNQFIASLTGAMPDTDHIVIGFTKNWNPASAYSLAGGLAKTLDEPLTDAVKGAVYHLPSFEDQLASLLCHTMRADPRFAALTEADAKTLAEALIAWDKKENVKTGTLGNGTQKEYRFRMPNMDDVLKVTSDKSLTIKLADDAAENKRLRKEMGQALLKMMKKSNQHYLGYSPFYHSASRRNRGAFGVARQRYRYSAKAKHYYEELKELLNAGAHLGFGTIKFVPEGIQVPQGMNRESMKNGLAEGHAYTVLDVVENAVNGQRFVKLRNPWGFYIREYDRSGQAKGNWTGKTHGVFLVELNDFMANFSQREMVK